MLSSLPLLALSLTSLLTTGTTAAPTPDNSTVSSSSGSGSTSSLGGRPPLRLLAETPKADNQGLGNITDDSANNVALNTGYTVDFADTELSINSNYTVYGVPITVTAYLAILQSLNSTLASISPSAYTKIYSTTLLPSAADSSATGTNTAAWNFTAVNVGDKLYYATLQSLVGAMISNVQALEKKGETYTQTLLGIINQGSNNPVGWFTFTAQAPSGGPGFINGSAYTPPNNNSPLKTTNYTLTTSSAVSQTNNNGLTFLNGIMEPQSFSSTSSSSAAGSSSSSSSSAQTPTIFAQYGTQSWALTTSLWQPDNTTTVSTSSTIVAAALQNILSRLVLKTLLWSSSQLNSVIAGTDLLVGDAFTIGSVTVRLTFDIAEISSANKGTYSFGYDVQYAIVDGIFASLQSSSDDDFFGIGGEVKVQEASGGFVDVARWTLLPGSN